MEERWRVHYPSHRQRLPPPTPDKKCVRVADTGYMHAIGSPISVLASTLSTTSIDTEGKTRMPETR